MNSWTLAKERAAAAKLTGKYNADFRVELNALNKHEGGNLVTAQVIGIKPMQQLTKRGWHTLSHSPSNYAHAANIYVMIIDKPVLDRYLEEAKVSYGLA